VPKKEMEKGKRINGKEANAEKYIPLYEFLMFDPIYKAMSDRAKILYCYLRDKTKYFEMQTELHQQGMGTKSYLDENGDTYILADNTELIYLFNCAESTLIRAKKELSKYGLLEEIKVKDQANKIYPLKPKKLSDVWKHIEEIKSLRAKQKEKRKKFHAEQKVKKESTEVSNTGNLQNESYGNLQNESYGNLQNESQIQPNHYKSNLIPLNNNLISSITEDILYDNLKNKVLAASLKRLIDELNYHSINLNTIEKIYEKHSNRLNEKEYIFVLENVITYYFNKNEPIKNIELMLNKSLSNYIADKLQDENTSQQKKEVIPDWFLQQKEEENKKESKSKGHDFTEMEDDVLLELYNNMKNTTIFKNQIKSIEQELYNRGRKALHNK